VIEAGRDVAEAGVAARDVISALEEEWIVVGLYSTLPEDSVV
jgi:hypothetical protein